MKFLENKYTSTYYNIIYSAKARPKIMSYTEIHHIIPKSLGGNNEPENLVVLTAREHFICHMLLIKMTNNIDKHKMIHAAIGMKRSRSYQHRYLNSRLYEIVRKEFAIISSEKYKGKSLTDEHRKKLSLASKGKVKSKTHAENISKALVGLKRGPMTEAEKEKRSTAMKGKPSPNKGNRFTLTLEQREKISESNRKRKLSDETKTKIAASLRARKQSSKFINS